MTVGAILTLGLGAPFGDVVLLPTLGYLSGTPAPPTPSQDQSTPGFLGRTVGRSYEEWERRRQSELEQRPRETVQTDDAPAVAEYIEQGRKITDGIARIRAERSAIEAESAILRDRLEYLESKKREKAAAAVRADILRKEQAEVLAKAQEAALLEELEALDVAYVAVIALAMIAN